MKACKQIVLLFILLLIIGILCFFHKWGNAEFIPSNENTVLLYLGDNKQPFYLRAKTWGLAGNHEQIVLY
jgi:hypothetical protein